MDGQSCHEASLFGMPRVLDDDLVETVLSAVEMIPPGLVASYGDIAEFAGRGGPRQVGWVMSRYGGAVAWWRVVHNDGRPASCHDGEALTRLLADGVPLRGERVVMSQARWAHLGD